MTIKDRTSGIYSYPTCRAAADRVLDADLVRVEVPTVFAKSLDGLYAAMDREQPEIILGVGQAGGRTGISVERVAINVNDARIEDNEGNQPEDEPIFKDGPAAYFIGTAHQGDGERDHGPQPSGVRIQHGRNLFCNHLMYGLLHRIETRNLKVRGGFVHIPYTHGQALDKVGTPSMAVGEIAKGLELAIQAAVPRAPHRMPSSLANAVGISYVMSQTD